MAYRYSKQLHICLVGILMVFLQGQSPVVAPPPADFATASKAYIAGNNNLAFRQFQQLADEGIPEAQYMLGLMYYEGRGAIRNLPRAAEWFFRAARQGDANAQYELGVLYAQGDFVQRDDAQAVKWFLQATKKNHPQAEYNLAVMYLLGTGVVESSKNAASWFRKSAARGFAEAQYQLGLLYLQGKGVTQDFVAAYKWWALAADNGLRLATLALNTLSNELSSYELAEADQRVLAWYEANNPERASAMKLRLGIVSPEASDAPDDTSSPDVVPAQATEDIGTQDP